MTGYEARAIDGNTGRDCNGSRRLRWTKRLLIAPVLAAATVAGSLALVTSTASDAEAVTVDRGIATWSVYLSRAETQRLWEWWARNESTVDGAKTVVGGAPCALAAGLTAAVVTGDLEAQGWRATAAGTAAGTICAGAAELPYGRVKDATRMAAAHGQCLRLRFAGSVPLGAYSSANRHCHN